MHLENEKGSQQSLKAFQRFIEIIYSLNTSDIQTVANEILNRELSEDEIEQIKGLVADNINWFDAIESAILSSKIAGFTEEEQG